MKTWERLFVGAFGTLLLGVGLYAVFLGPASPAWRYLGGGIVCLIAINAIYGAITNKRPWIAKIGPLP